MPGKKKSTARGQLALNRASDKATGTGRSGFLFNVCSAYKDRSNPLSYAEVSQRKMTFSGSGLQMGAAAVPWEPGNGDQTRVIREYGRNRRKVNVWGRTQDPPTCRVFFLKTVHLCVGMNFREVVFPFVASSENLLKWMNLYPSLPIHQM